MLLIFNNIIEILRKLRYDQMTLQSLKFLIGKLDEIQFPDPDGSYEEPNMPEEPLSRQNALEYVDYLCTRIIISYTRGDSSWCVPSKQQYVRAQVEEEVQKIESVIEDRLNRQ